MGLRTEESHVDDPVSPESRGSASRPLCLGGERVSRIVRLDHKRWLVESDTAGHVTLTGLGHGGLLVIHAPDVESMAAAIVTARAEGIERGNRNRQAARGEASA